MSLSIQFYINNILKFYHRSCYYLSRRLLYFHESALHSCLGYSCLAFHTKINAPSEDDLEVNLNIQAGLTANPHRCFHLNLPAQLVWFSCDEPVTVLHIQMWNFHIPQLLSFCFILSPRPRIQPSLHISVKLTSFH